MTNIAIFASGRGSNAKKIIEYFKGHQHIQVKLIVSNKANAPVLEIAQANGLEKLVLNRPSFYQTQDLLTTLNNFKIDFIILAGFLWLIPPYLVQAFRKKMVNIHPALLPKFGGKGMYGMHVHEAVKLAGETETGITIHLVNEQYDEGAVLFQARCAVNEQDSPLDIAKKVQRLEHLHFAPVIEKLVTQLEASSTDSF